MGKPRLDEQDQRLHAHPARLPGFYDVRNENISGSWIFAKPLSILPRVKAAIPPNSYHGIVGIRVFLLEDAVAAASFVEVLPGVLSVS